MKVLIVKMSSMGDVIHTVPAVTDAVDTIPGIEFEWVIEEAFAEIPAMHPAVRRVIPVAIRRWRGDWSAAMQELRPALSELQDQPYDCVIDAQGLLKSAVVSKMARGRTVGLDKASAREPLASRLYDHALPGTKGQNAAERVRQLFAGALDYT
ncbi:MAG: lipopolysaccharide heptosyltransferase I, partial [Pseudomonadales bacterium]|nr:lipopolysaccharide heptosyltransferase I [Pseudomonadales bacterium]